MTEMLDTDALREISNYIESLPNAPDNTNGSELIDFAAQTAREISEN